MPEPESRSTRRRVEPSRGQRRPREDEGDPSEEPHETSRRLALLDGLIADVVSVKTEYAKRQGLHPQEKCTREIAKEIIQDLDRKHAAKLKRFEASAKNARYQRPHDPKKLAEAYSPPRLVEVAGEFGVRPAWSLDLTQLDRDDGLPWDFNVESKRLKAVELLRKDQPNMLMVGPTCAPFCSLNVGWNYSRMQVGNAEDMIADGMRHLAFATHICLEQTRAGRYYGAPLDCGELGHRRVGVVARLAGSDGG